MLKKFGKNIWTGLIWLWTKFCWPFKTIWRKWCRFYKKLSRSCKWAKRMWNNPDWDYEYMIEMMVYKLKDIQYQLDVVDSDFVDLRHQPKTIGDENGETVDHLESLDKAIELGEKLLEDKYGTDYPEDIKKWFDEHGHFSKLPDELNKKYWKYLDESYRQEKNDRNEFFNIIRDNHEKWWS